MMGPFWRRMLIVSGFIIGIAIVGLLAFNAYAILTEGDGEPQVAQPSPTTGEGVGATAETESEAERRTRLCEAALQGGDKLGIRAFCFEPPEPTPPLPTPPPSRAKWCWGEKARLAYNEIMVDANKASGEDFRTREEELVEAQRQFSSQCSQYALVPTQSDALDEYCRVGRDKEYEWRQAGVSWTWTSTLENWQDDYCQ